MIQPTIQSEASASRTVVAIQFIALPFLIAVRSSHASQNQAFVPVASRLHNEGGLPLLSLAERFPE